MTKLICGIFLAGALLANAAELSPALKALQGKWKGERTNNEGRRTSTLLEFKDNQFNFRATGSDGEVRLVAKGTVKADKVGELRFLTLADIKAGRTEDDLQPVDDERSSVYTLREGKLYIASGFDRDRENERPRVEEYTREQTASPSSTAKPAGEMLLGQWKMEATIGERNMDYELRFEKADTGVKGTLISPRTGEYKAKSVSLTDGKFEMQVDREIEGNQVTFVYKGNYKNDGLSGTLEVKGFEDQFTGNWTAKR